MIHQTNKKMRTAKQWFETIADETIRNNAIRNTSEEKLNEGYGSLEDALTYSFSWSENKEGFDYWLSIVNSILANELELIEPINHIDEHIEEFQGRMKSAMDDFFQHVKDAFGQQTS